MKLPYYSYFAVLIMLNEASAVSNLLKSEGR